MSIAVIVEYILYHNIHTVVDLGCGSALLSSRIKEQCPQSSVIGIDFHFKSFFSSPHSSTHYIVADALNVPLAGRSVGAIICKALLRNVTYPELVLREASRILCKHGYLFIHEGHRIPERRFYDMKSELAASGLLGPRHPGFDVSLLKSQLANCGFETEDPIPAGTSCFASPPYTRQDYTSEAFLLIAQKQF